MSSHYEKEQKLAEILSNLNAISEKRAKWQPDYDSTRQKLYVLLGSCLPIYEELKGTKNEGAFIKTVKDEFILRGMPIQKNLNIMTLIVRKVFDSNSQSVYTWARALRVAVREKVTPETFVDWVNNNNGIEEVAKIKGATTVTKKRRKALEEAEHFVEDWLDVWRQLL
ncbi:MAG: hypothetical protein NTY69_09965 [Methylococcales bacterium]|nr:hypothetical protein [Methylococcales bacterium]